MHLDPSDENVQALLARRLDGPVVMLNLLRYRPVADYGDHAELDPGSPISGEAAYRRYMDATLPHLEASGGSVRFLGQGGAWFIGPTDERWDAALLVAQDSLESFFAFASNPAYLVGLGHRVAALEDSRLLPLAETPYGGPSDRPASDGPASAG